MPRGGTWLGWSLQWQHPVISPSHYIFVSSPNCHGLILRHVLNSPAGSMLAAKAPVDEERLIHRPEHGARLFECDSEMRPLTAPGSYAVCPSRHASWRSPCKTASADQRPVCLAAVNRELLEAAGFYFEEFWGLLFAPDSFEFCRLEATLLLRLWSGEEPNFTNSWRWGRASRKQGLPNFPD